jgi:ADP-heptose:LPS heptosyltransferase
MKRPSQVIHIAFAKQIASFLLALAALFLRVWRAFVARRAPESSRPTVLLIEPFGLGDVISHEPLIRALRGHGVEVTLCARAEWRPLFPDLRWVNSEIAWGRHARADKYVLSDYLSPEFRKCFRELRAAARGAIGIDTRGDIRSVLLLYLAGCRQVITLSHYLGSDLKMPSFVGQIVESSAELRRWELNLRFAAALQASGNVPGPPTFPHFIARHKDGARRTAGLIPIAPWKGKWWPEAKWRALVAQLVARGIKPAGLCGPGQRDLTRQQLGNGIDAIECGSVAEWANRLQQFAFIVTLDTGPMHVSDALGIPVVALFGQGSLPLWAPSHPQSIVVSHQSENDFRICAPIEAHTAHGEEFMRRISVEEVLAAVDRIIAGQAHAARGVTAGP